MLSSRARVPADAVGTAAEVMAERQQASPSAWSRARPLRAAGAGRSGGSEGSAPRLR